MCTVLMLQVVPISLKAGLKFLLIDVITRRNAFHEKDRLENLWFLKPNFLLKGCDGTRCSRTVMDYPLTININMDSHRNTCERNDTVISLIFF